MKKIIAAFLVVVMVMALFCACDPEPVKKTDSQKQQEVAKKLEEVQPTPTDIEYSLERYNLIRRAYWVNGLEEKARTLVCPVEKPLGYIVLMLEGVGIVDTYIVDGKVSSLNSFLTPDSEYYEKSTGAGTVTNKWLADVDGSYGENDLGIFFFTADGAYKEWTGTYFYSSEPFVVEDTILKTKEVG